MGAALSLLSLLFNWILHKHINHVFQAVTAKLQESINWKLGLQNNKRGKSMKTQDARANRTGSSRWWMSRWMVSVITQTRYQRRREHRQENSFLTGFVNGSVVMGRDYDWVISVCLKYNYVFKIVSISANLRPQTQRRGISSCTASWPPVPPVSFQCSPVRPSAAYGAWPSAPRCCRYLRCRIWCAARCPSWSPERRILQINARSRT